MGLSTLTDGIIISEVTIANATNVSGEPLPFGTKKVVDVGVELTLEVGRSFQPKLTVAGNFKRDPISNEITDWGSAFRILELMRILCPEFIEELKTSHTVPPDAVAAMRNKKLLRLTYVTGRKEDGRYRYADWTTVGSIEAGEANLKQKWERSVKNGYPKNFAPEAVGDSAGFTPIS